MTWRALSGRPHLADAADLPRRRRRARATHVAHTDVLADLDVRARALLDIGPGTYCSTRLIMPFELRNEGSGSMSMTWWDSASSDHFSSC